MGLRLQVYTAVLGAVGILLLVLHGPSVLDALTAPVIPVVLLLGVLAVTFEVFRVVLPNGVSFSFGVLFTYLILAVAGVPAALVVQAAAAVAMIVAKRIRRWEQVAFNVGAYLISSYTGGVVWRYLLDWLPVPAGVMLQGPALMLAGLVHFLVNIILLAYVHHIRSRRPLPVIVGDMVQDGYVGMLGTVAFLWPLWVSYGQSGWMAVLLFASTLVAFRWAVNRYMHLKETYLAALGNLGALVERQLAGTERHSQRVADLARAMAEELKLSPDDIDTLHAAGLLHDIGEAYLDPHIVAVAARGAILPLTDQTEYQRHPALGADQVASIPGMAEVAACIRHHHEQWDGFGYPQGLQGEQIPRLARILAAVEFVETGGGNVAAKVARVAEAAGKQIDPGLSRALVAALYRCERPERTGAAVMAASAVRQLQDEILAVARKSQVLQSLGMARFYRYAQDGLAPVSGDSGNPVDPAAVLSLAERAVQRGEPVREHLITGTYVLDVFAFPTGGGSASVVVFDVTAALERERQEYRRIFRAYRDVLATATRGRFVLLDEADRAALLADGVRWGVQGLDEAADGERARRLIRDAAQNLGLSRTEVFRLTLCASEMMTNVFKHAGRGAVEVYRADHALRVVVSDQGGGIPLDRLPQAVLVDGFSTQVSLGKGFHVVLQYAERLYLCSTPSGTTVIIEKRLPADTEAVPDSQPLPGWNRLHHLHGSA